jgi:hypothetical protein
LDSDDTWDARKLFLQVSVLESFPEVDLLFTDFLNINLANEQQTNNFQAYQGAMDSLVKKPLDEYLYSIHSGFLQSLAMGNFIATDTVILRKALFEKFDGFNESLRNSEDFELWWRMGLEGYHFAYLDQILMRRYKPIVSLSSLSFINIRGHLTALNLCNQAAVIAQREDLLAALKQPYRNAWHNMITACAQDGNLPGMLHAFRQSLTYGFRPGALRLLMGGLYTLTGAGSKHTPGDQGGD